MLENVMKIRIIDLDLGRKVYLKMIGMTTRNLIKEMLIEIGNNAMKIILRQQTIREDCQTDGL